MLFPGLQIIFHHSRYQDFVSIYPQAFHLLTMLVQYLITATAVASCAMAQTLNIPTRVGSIISLPSPSVIKGSVDLGNREYDRGRDCNTDDDTGSDSAVFILENGATLSNVIIGSRQLEGVHCKGACTLRNVWFRDVCEGTFISMIF